MHPDHKYISKIWIALFSLLALVLNVAGSSQNWQIQDGKISPLNLRKVVGMPTQKQPLRSGDLDQNGTLECLGLVDETVQVSDCGQAVLWQSPPDWRVTEAQIGDLNRDGLDEAILLVWRAYRPWPVDKFMPSGGRIKEFHDQKGESCQIILIGWSRGDWRELWAGSGLASPVEQLGVADLDGDGWQELAALEKPYDSSASEGELTVWRWLGFGFSLMDRLEGTIQQVTVVNDGSLNWLVTK